MGSSLREIHQFYCTLKRGTGLIEKRRNIWEVLYRDTHWYVASLLLIFCAGLVLGPLSPSRRRAVSP